MDWIMQPIAGFNSFCEELEADQCSGGAELRSCTCQGGLLVCSCNGGLKVGRVVE
jgi:hypothetical protein